MLKEENMQLSLKLSSVEATSNSGHHNKVNDLEKTVLTLRGKVFNHQNDLLSFVFSLDKIIVMACLICLLLFRHLGSPTKAVL